MSYFKINITFLLIFALFYNISCFDEEIKCPEKKHVVCYVATWAYYRTGKGNHKLTNINPKLCTHFVYSFTGLDIDGKITTLDPNYDNTGVKNFIKLKEKNPCAKFLIAIGGWEEGSEKYSFMSETAERREIFAESVMRFMVFNNFDGFDLDWEYPGFRGGIESDKQNFIELLKLLKQKFSSRKKILSIAIPASVKTLMKAYEVAQMCDNVDFVSLMSYDMNHPNQTSVHAPLKLEKNEQRDTIDDSIKYLIKKGCPSKKIILGITSVAKTFTLKYPEQYNVGAPIVGPGSSGPYLKSPGSLGFNEMCTKFEGSGWYHQYRKNNAVKISFKNNFWAVYDDEETVTQKGQYALSNQLGGLMFWSIDTDDFLPECHQIKYPLLIAANKVLKNSIK